MGVSIPDELKRKKRKRSRAATGAMGLGYPLYDITASGMTHYTEKPFVEKNQYRVGRVFQGFNYGLMKVEWMEEGPKLDIAIMDQENTAVRRVRVQF